MIRLLLAALLASFVHMPARRCIERRFDEIASVANAAADHHGVPASLLLSVGFHESWLGCHGERDWGAPASRRDRHRAGTPDDAARAIATGYRVCGTWRGAVTRFRAGLCRLRATDERQEYVASVMRLADRIAARAGIAMEGR
jgi:hypothetical protein